MADLASDVQSLKAAAGVKATAEFWASDPDVGSGVAGMRIARLSDYGILAVYRSTDTYDFDAGTGTAALLIDVNGNVNLTNAALIINGSSGYIALGNPAPTSATVGTGIWIDYTGIYGLNANTQQFYLRASDGKAVAGGGNVILDSTGIRLLAAASPGGAYIKWVTSGNETLGYVVSSYGGTSASTILVGQGKDGTYPTGVAALQASDYTATNNPTLQLYSTGSVTARGTDSVEAQLVRLYNRDFAGGTTVQNTAVETTIYSATIKANQLGANGIIACELGGDLQNNSAGAINLTFRVKYGGTTMATMRVSVATFTGTGGYFLRTRMGNDGHTNVQRNFAFVVASKNGAGGFSATMSDYAAAAVDSTSDQTFAITAQWASADPNAGVFSKGGLIEMEMTN